MIKKAEDKVEKTSTEDMIKTFENIVNSSVSQKMLNDSLEYCEKCNKTRLESALRYYVGKQENICFKCKLILPVIELIIKKGLDSFNVSKESFIEGMQDDYWIQGLVSVFKGMSKFGVKKPFVPGAPFQIVWNITRQCNFHCIHCYENAGKKDPDELTTSEIHQGIDKLADYGVTSLAFSGGEPTTHPDIVDFVKHGTKRGMFISLASNGYLFADENRVNEISDAGLKFIQISLDGLNPKTHDEFRQVPGSWEHAIKAIDNFNKTDVSVGISTTVTKHNIDEIPEMIKFLRKKDINWLMLYNFIPTGNGSDVREIDLSPQERFKLLEYIYEENGKDNMQILSTAPQFADVAVHMNQNEDNEEEKLIPTHFYNAKYNNPAMEELSSFIGGCGAGRFYMGMEPNGDLYPCVFLPHDKQLKVGNIQEDLDKIWTENIVLEELRNKDILKGCCSNCDSKYICGGCRARAYTMTGDYLEEDPGCIKSINNFETFIKKYDSQRISEENNNVTSK